jgi:hypothetical protein
MLGVRKPWRDLTSAAILIAGLLASPVISLLVASEPSEADASPAVARECTGAKLGTTVTWYKDTRIAAQLARDQGKLLYVIQVSGNFALEEFT